ncbi:ABC transporter ATP-binding protein [Alteribacter aurantiacus]|uniref:ABC transporter ATP-binding protein n=1 Tax=Alteribacter aurantiacus TaxID=254410 RepID=UPI0004119DFB|nr:ATP-binding cassette domain-containing protein [Alteribacter aurantiacus]
MIRANVKKTYRLDRHHVVTAVKRADMVVREQTFTVITGPSGSGKSTLLAVLGLLEEPTEGKVLLNGNEVQTEKERARVRLHTFGFVHQYPRLHPTLSALDNVLLPLALMKNVTTEEVERGRALLEEVGLKERIDHLPFQMSGGEQRRVGLARGLMLDPAVLFADEPTASLDPENSLLIFSHLHKWFLRGKTVVVATHDPIGVRFATDVYDMREGILTKKSIRKSDPDDDECKDCASAY